MTILPSVYWGSAEWYARILQCGDCVIDLGENYVKRSERNRTRIMTAGGVMQLSAQLCHADRPRQPMRDMRLDYSKRWQHQHWTAMVSAYRSSPYFDHYADRFADLYGREWRYLVDYNMEILSRTLDVLRCGDCMPAVSESYVEAAAGDTDLRDKRRGSTFSIEPYVQVFAERVPFEPNLSIVDLLMCEGPAAVAILRRCRL
ncbi:MAG: WbqC family protein [Alistipes sp.]|nr:WbqC family protein [Alistipes sp.]MDE6862139.1 WbqC family protein [Alistipes sp.]